MNGTLQTLLDSANARLQAEFRLSQCSSVSGELFQPICRACLKALSTGISSSERRMCVLETLPDDVLLVLARWLSVYQLWTLANSCRAIRHRLHSFPQLWNSFKTVGTGSNGPCIAVARTIARFAGRPPARLCVSGHDKLSSMSIASLLNDWIPGLEVLHAQLFPEQSSGPDSQDVPIVMDALARPAPNLDTLELNLALPYGAMQDLPTSFLGATAGRLRRCVLENVRLDLSAPGLYPALSTLTTFGLFENGTADRIIDASHLQALLDSLPLLENFAFAFKRFSAIADGGPAPILRLPPRLQHFAIINFSPDPAEIASAFNTVPKMTIAGVDPGLYALVSGDIHLLLPKQLHIRIRFVDESEGARIVTMFSWIHRRLPSLTVRSLGMYAPTTARVTRVQLHEWQWAIFLALPTLPQLEELCIVIASCSEYNPQVQYGAGLLFLSSRLQPGMIKLNALKRLEIYSGVRYWDIPRENEECAQLRQRLVRKFGWFGGSVTCVCHIKCPLSLEDLADFISWLIGPDRQLGCLVLGGITDIADGNPATALHRLETMTQTIEIMERPPREVVHDCRMSPRESAYPGMPAIDCFSFDDDFSLKDSIDPIYQ